MKPVDLDVIITTNSKDEALWKMTHDAIRSLRQSQGGENFNLIVVETNTAAAEYPEADVTVKPNEPFRINRFFNLGARHCRGDYLLVTNNDVLYERDWWREMKADFIRERLDTACPQMTNEQPDIMERWLRQKHTTVNLEGYDWFFGQAWVITKGVREWIFPLDENIHFYYNEDDMVMRLRERKCRHHLVHRSRMQHFQAKSHHILKEEGRYQEVTSGAQRYFERKWRRFSWLSLKRWLTGRA